jgi:hypothetical protein
MNSSSSTFLDYYEVEVARYYCTSNNDEESLSVGTLRMKLQSVIVRLSAARHGSCLIRTRREWRFTIV